MAAIRCPHCNLLLELKGVRAGRFTPKCSRCGERFQVEISDDPKPKAYVSKIKPKSKDKGHHAKPAAPRTEAKPPAPPPPPKPPPEQVTQVSGGGVAPADDDDDDISISDMELSLPPDLKPPAEPEEDPNATLVAADANAADDSIPAAEILDQEPSPGELIEAKLAKTQATRRPESPPAKPAAPPPPRPAAADATAVSHRPAPAAASRQAPPSQGQGELSGLLGGYQIEKKLGEGGMGAVYLARQLSLDRPVALKTMHPQWASDPTFLARFTREAYAAAQLTHHQIVQIHDIGQDQDVPFFSMEFVRGQSLGDLIKHQGKVDPEAAAGYILQAARGLKFAHDQGMVHRDVKPENLLLNEQGIVKVADLGLVKTPGQAAEAAPGRTVPPRPAPVAGINITGVDAAMGTPAYMAPEQAVDAARVDARADIYSLGCTLYALVTGQAPFQGKTVMEIITKHATQAITPPELIVERVPKELSAIVQKMTAKKPENRYQDMGQVIQALETFLGVSSAGPFTPREEHAELLSDNVRKFYGSPTARYRSTLILGFYLFCLALVVTSVFMGLPGIAGGVVGLAVMATVFYQVAVGVMQRSYFLRRCRQLVFGSRLADWLKFLGAAALTVAVLWALGLLLYWVLFCFLALAIAAGFAWAVDRRVASERRGPIGHVQDMLKSMRLRGLEEEALRQFACKYAGQRWEAFYESLFGYEAKIKARELWGRGDVGRLRPKEGAWRDPIINWIEQRMRQRQEAREKKMLQAVEEKSLRASGVSAGEAQRQAERAAATLVSNAAEYKEAATLATGGKGPPVNARSIADTAQTDDQAAKRRARARGKIRSGPLVWAFGRLTRFAVGALLLTGFGMWVNQNGLMSSQQLPALNAIDVHQLGTSQGIQSAGATLGQLGAHTKPLKIPGVPAAATDLFNGFNPGVAGLMLIVSAFVGRWMLGVVVLPAAAIIFAGQRLGIPAVGPLSAPALSMAAGLALALLGFLFARK